MVGLVMGSTWICSGPLTRTAIHISIKSSRHLILVIIAFMAETALDRFRRTHGWKVGVDGSVAIVTLGVGGSIDTNRITSPVVGFILDRKGLMYNLTLEGSKLSRIRR